MKKNNNCAVSRHRKLFLIMRLSIALNLIFTVVITANSFSQEDNISLNVENAKVKEVFRNIENQSAYRFFYNDELSDINRLVSLDIKDFQIEEVLDKLFSSTEISYTILEDELIVIAPKRTQKQNSVSGTITDAETGEPIPGVNIVIEGTSSGTISGLDGNYSIEVPNDDAVLVYSFVGYLTERIAVSGRDVINVELSIDRTQLEEVVVIGYGTQRREEVTTAISKVNSEDFVQGQVKSPVQLLQGKVPGLAVSNPSGDPTAGVQLMIRGVTTLGGGGASSRDPLFVVDGVPSGSIYTIAPEDIESIDVLKDGSAAAIYGTRGSNGVVLITTKRGKKGAGIRVELNSSVSIENITGSRDILTAEDYISYKSDTTQIPKFNRMIGEFFGTRADSLDKGYATDWVDEITRQAFGQVHSLSVSGGNENSSFISSVTYRNQEGTLLNSGRESVAARFNASHSALNDRLRFNFNINNNNFDDNIIYTRAYCSALAMNPTQPVYEEDGSYFEFDNTLSIYNPVAMLLEETDERKWVQTLFSGKVIFEPIEGLNISAMGAMQRYNEMRDKWSTKDHFNTTVNNLNGTIWKWANLNVDYTAEYTIDYKKSLGDHSFNLLGGYSYQMFTHRGSYMYAENMATDNLDAWEFSQSYSIEEGKAELDAGRSESKLISFFSRLTYNYKQKYLFMASLRQDGSSKFGDNSKWGLFPAASVGWRINEEPFLKSIAFVNELKLRAGYGSTGVTPQDAYRSLPLLGFDDSKQIIYDGHLIKGVVPFQNYNPDLRWEEKHELNAGVDFALFNNRISGSFDVFNRTTQDMLWTYDVPKPPYLVDNMLANAATLENKGFEASINTVPVQQKLRVEISGNISYSRNKLKSLSSGIFTLDYIWAGWAGSPIQQSTHYISIGDEVGNFYGWEVDSLSSKGSWYYVTDSMGSIINPAVEDKRLLGNGIPKLFAGLNINITYAGFDFYAGLRGAFDYQIYNQYRSHFESFNVLRTNMNVTRATLEPQMDGNYVANAAAYNSYYIEDGDYVKIDNVSLGYTFGNLQRLYIKRMRIYISAMNLHTFTKYKGLDPEVSFAGLDPGIESWERYPTTRTFTAGLNLVF